MPDTFRYWVYKWVKHMDPALMELLVGEGWGDTLQIAMSTLKEKYMDYE